MEGKQMKCYHMIIQRPADLDGKTRREYISTQQGSAPAGWRCVAVCGYHDEPKTRETRKTRKTEGGSNE